MSVKVAGVTHEAAKFAVLNWHYSKQMPIGKLIKYGVWENEKFIGVVLFGRGATPNLGKPYDLQQNELCELVRVALDKHEAPVSQIVSKAIKNLKLHNTGLRLIVSFADPDQGHYGGIYQAGNWIYTGSSNAAKFFNIKGKKTHPRSVGAVGGIQSLNWIQKNLDPKAEIIITAPKHRYLYPLDRTMRKKIIKIALPYPSAVEGLEESRIDSVNKVQVQSLPTAQNFI